MSNHTYFKCEPHRAVISISCCEGRQEAAKRGMKATTGSLTEEGAIYRSCRSCIEAGMPIHHQRNRVPRSEVENVVFSPTHSDERKAAIAQAATTVHTRDQRIYDRSYNPFKDKQYT